MDGNIETKKKCQRRSVQENTLLGESSKNHFTLQNQIQHSEIHNRDEHFAGFGRTSEANFVKFLKIELLEVDLYFFNSGCLPATLGLLIFAIVLPFWGCTMTVSRAQRKRARMFTLPRPSIMHLEQ